MGHLAGDDVRTGPWRLAMDRLRSWIYALSCRAAHVRDRSLDERRRLYASPLLSSDRVAAVHAKPGQRDVLIDLFDRHAESQELE